MDKRALYENIMTQVAKIVKKAINESVTVYGRTKLTYDDIPAIMNGELPYASGSYNNEKWWIQKLPNNRYINYLCTEEERAEQIQEFIKYYNNYESKSKQEMEEYLRFNLSSKDEAEEWLLGQEICSLYDKLGYKTEMWSQLGHIGGIEITKDGNTERIVYAYPSKKELYNIIEKLQNNQINESEAIEKHGTHRTYYLNMDLDTPKAGRTAPKISVKELEDKITEFFWKYGADDYDRRDHKEGSKISPGKFLYRMVGNWKDEKKIKQNSKLPEMNIDLLKIYHDTENCDAVGDIRTTKSGIPYILGQMGGDWEEPILFMVYWDGKTFRGYIPERGNQYNRDTKGALGNNEEADEAFIRKQFKDEIEDGTEYSKIKKNIRYNKDACIADFEARLKKK